MKLVTMIALLLLLAAVGAGSATPRVPQPQIIPIQLNLPAVGNLEDVGQWRLGRIQHVTRQSATTDILIDIRDAGGRVTQIIAPGPPLADLARMSRWSSSSSIGRNDYVERMIGYDVDNDGRLIAMVSLEPVPRSERRIGRRGWP